MSLTVSRQNMTLMNKLFTRTSGKNKVSFKPLPNLLKLQDVFSSSSSSSTNLLSSIVKKMQEAINQPFSGGLSRVNSSAFSLNVSVSSSSQQIAYQEQAYTPTAYEVERAIGRMGGESAIANWVVDGKTKVEINGSKVVVDVNQGGSGQADTSSLSAREQAEKALARFGLDSTKLDGDLNALRDELRATASMKTTGAPGMATAIEYALEDAFARISSFEAGGNDTTAPVQAEDGTYEAQRQKNLAQADSIVNQLGLDNSQRWGIQSLAEDLAVFGMDMTVMSKDPYKVAEDVRNKSLEMLADLDKRFAGTEGDYIRERNRITGASARLVHGLQGSGGTAAWAMSSVSVSGSVDVKIDGTSINASAIIAVGNVIVDPLVLDLNGDGIDLKAAEDGSEFDMNGDGNKTGMGFIRGDDAFLFMDTYGDGIVRDGRQLFGNQDGYENGFEMLRAYDDNGDGVIDENDAIYDQLMLWVEKTEDGVCESDETMSLREAGIKSINLGYENTREDDGKGNLIGQIGSFTRDDGSQGMTADVWLRERAASQGQ